MKRKNVLILTIGLSAKKGIYYYLEAVFRNYLHIKALLTSQMDGTFDIESYDLIIFPSQITYEKVKQWIPESKKIIFATRIIDPANYYKIINIPPSSTVYLVNDNKDSAMEAMTQLQELGFTQYQFIPFYPGCGNYADSVSYAITVGEPEIVPAGVPTVIDVGNRIVDISTINEITSYFELPASLLNEITKYYIINFVRVLKLSNSQLYNSLENQRINQSIINNINTGFCAYDRSGQIKQFNLAFCKQLCLHRSYLLGSNINTLFEESDFPLSILKNNTQAPAYVKNSLGEILKISNTLIMRNDADILFLCTVNPTESVPVPPMTPESPSHERIPIYLFSDYLTQDPSCQELLKKAAQIALTDYNILIQGESGTGKEVLARAIHNNSKRKKAPFVHLAAASLPSRNAEANLLGSAGSSFTDEQSGILEKANGGTLFVDGIEHMDLQQQSILLSALTHKAITRVGGLQSIPMDFRIIASSCADLYPYMREGRFMPALYFSVNVVSLYTIPLRRRKKDISYILEYYMRNLLGNEELTLGSIFSEEFLAFVTEYDWPGNTNEAMNLCRYLNCVWRNRKFTLSDLPDYILQHADHTSDLHLSDMEKEILTEVKNYPKTGRGRLITLLQNKGIFITDASLRSSLSHLKDVEMLHVNRTRGGCEITEKGALYLKKNDSL